MVAPEPSRQPLDPADCSIIATVEALGDVWSILVLRELFLGVRRFNDIQRDLGISRSVLTDRLARLVALGVVRTVPYQEPGDRVRHEYRPTRKGVGLLPVLVALKAWGDEHLNGGHQTVRITERESGEEVGLEFRTASGRPAEPNQFVVQELAKTCEPRPDRLAGSTWLEQHERDADDGRHGAEPERP
jgi:DNA-binding HxlR family transcriptional regulator